MALDSGEVRLAAFGHVYVAPVGSTIPADTSVPFTAEWRELGYTTEDGVSLTPSVDINDINAWQSKVPVKRSLTSIDFDVKFTLLQTTQLASSLFFFGEDWVVAGSEASLTVSSNPGLVERAVAIEYLENEGDTTVNRIILPRALLTDREDLTLNRSDAVQWGLTWKALDSNGIVIEVQSNNPDLLFS